jgi:hypothetical protein
MFKNKAVALRILEDFRSGLISRRQLSSLAVVKSRDVSMRNLTLKQKLKSFPKNTLVTNQAKRECLAHVWVQIKYVKLINLIQ